MDIKIQRDDLLRVLQTVVGIVERRQSLPILSNALLVVEDNRLEIRVTDLEMQIACRAQVQNLQPGAVTAPARKLHDICRGLAEGVEIQLSESDGRLKLQSGRSRFVLSTLPADEFPKLEGSGNESEFTVPASLLKSLIVRTQFAMAQQDVRYYLNGLLLEFGDQCFRSVATDGHRLAIAEETLAEVPDAGGQFIVPRKTVQEIVRLLDKGEEAVHLKLAAGQMTIVLDEVTLVSKLIDGNYPEYRRVIPDSGDRQVKADREIVRRALSRAAILSNEKFRGVRLEFSGDTMRIETQNPEQEEALEEVEVEYRGEPLKIGFNVNYLVEALNAIESESFVIDMRGPDSSGLLYDPEKPQHRYVVMPMRL